MSYPVERTEYCKVVGKTRVENIAGILEHFGFAVVTKEPENHDVDIWVYRDNNLVLIIEVLNWRKKVYMDFNRAMAIRENFSNANYNNSRKLLVFSFFDNIKNQLSYFGGLDIDFLELGFQTQPYYVFYVIKRLASDMRPNTLATKLLVKRMIQTYLRGRDLI